MEQSNCDVSKPSKVHSDYMAHFDLPQELKEFQARVRAIARSEIAPHAAETDRSEQYPWHCIEVLKRAGSPVLVSGVAVDRARELAEVMVALASRQGRPAANAASRSISATSVSVSSPAATFASISRLKSSWDAVSCTALTFS
jgi:alkylation response protein AidB-like acyl-CoA dehydrogenase